MSQRERHKTSHEFYFAPLWTWVQTVYTDQIINRNRLCLSQDIFHSLKPTAANFVSTCTEFLVTSNDSSAPKTNAILLLEDVSQLELEASWASVSSPKSFWFYSQSFQIHLGSGRQIWVNLSACSVAHEVALSSKSKAALLCVSPECPESFWFFKYCWTIALK